MTPRRHAPLTRSETMSRIRGRDTGPELLLRRALWAAGIRYRTQWRHPAAGRIDIALPGRRIAIQVDGCFWHGCPLHGSVPGSNTAFWKTKLDRNKDRDARQTESLILAGWKVVRCWEHEVEDPGSLRLLVARISDLFRNRDA